MKRPLSLLLFLLQCVPPSRAGPCSFNGEQAQPDGVALVMCSPHVGLYMQQAHAMFHVVGFRVLPGSTGVQLAFFIEGPEILGIHLLGVLDRSRLTFEARLTDSTSATPWPCKLSLPADPGLRVIDLVLATCVAPAELSPPMPGSWSIEVSWPVDPPPRRRNYTVPFSVCSVTRFRMSPCEAREIPGPAETAGLPASWNDPLPRIGLCLSSVSNARDTLSLRHIVSFLEYYRIAGVHHVTMHMRPDVFIDFAPELSRMYSQDAPEFILELIDSGYVARDPFVVTRFPYYDQGEKVLLFGDAWQGC